MILEVRQGKVRLGLVRRSQVRHGAVRHGKARKVVKNLTAWFGMERYGKAR